MYMQTCRLGSFGASASVLHLVFACSASLNRVAACKGISIFPTGLARVVHAHSKASLLGASNSLLTSCDLDRIRQCSATQSY